LFKEVVIRLTSLLGQRKVFHSQLSIKIINTDGKALASSEVKGFDNNWKYFPADLKASVSDPIAHLEISGEGNGTLYLDMVSLMPDQTWKNHGMRVDLAEALEKPHPKFLRFLGGCWVEGDDFILFPYSHHWIFHIIDNFYHQHA
jgi:alpha-L-arabinofuranosidase